MASPQNNGTTKEGYFDGVDLDAQSAHSVDQHIHKDVRKQNFLDFFMDEMAVDRFVAAHMYGDANIQDYDLNLSQAECSALEESLLNMSQTFVRRTKAVKLEQKTARKLSYFETYIAVIKGYCAILIILLPKSFSNGGYIFSPIAMLLSGFVTTICVQKLVQTGLKYDVFSYSLICQKVLGKQGKMISDVMICLSQFSFSLGQMVFVLKSMQTSVN